MKRFFCFYLLSVFLISCTNAVTPLPAFTETISPTSSVEPTATLELTPTETPDPNMPPGATGKDGNEWIKEKETGTYVWTEIKNNKGEEVLSMGLKNNVTGDNLLDGGIPMIEHDDNEYLEDMTPLHILSQEDVSVPYFRHPDHPYSKAEAQVSFTGFYTGMLREGDGLRTAQRLENQQNGIISFPFTTPDGQSYGWNPNKNTGYTFIEVKYDELNKDKYPNLCIWETKDLTNESLIFRWTAFTDENNNAVVLGSVEHPKGLAPIEWMTQITGPLGLIARGGSISGDIGYFFDTQQLVKAALRTPHPHF